MSFTIAPFSATMKQPMSKLKEQFGPIDIYLFDQILRGNIAYGMTIFDAGCGSGRNLFYLLREGYEVFGVDPDPSAIAVMRRIAPNLPVQSFREEPVEASTFPDGIADVVISSAVLHFAKDDEHFRAMLLGSWARLKQGGLFFAGWPRRLALKGRPRRSRVGGTGCRMGPNGTWWTRRC